MRIVTTLILMLISCVAVAQDSYRVMLKGEVVIDKAVDDSVPILSLSSIHITTLRIAYRAADLSQTKLMRRQLMLFSQSGEQLSSHQMQANEGVAEIKMYPGMLKKKYPEILLYTISIPVDPEIAKRIKPRRVLLAKIYWT